MVMALKAVPTPPDAIASSTQPIDIKPLSQDREYVKEAAKLSHVRCQLREFERELASIQTRLSIFVVSNEAERVNKAAEKVIAGECLEVADMDDRQSFLARASELRAQIEVFGKACVIQREIVDKIRDDRSVAVARALQAKHRESVARTANALEELWSAIEDEEGLFAALRAAGYEPHLPFLSPRYIRPRRDWDTSRQVADLRAYAEGRS